MNEHHLRSGRLLGPVLACALGGAAACTGTGAPEDGMPTTKSEARRLAGAGKADWGVDICEQRGWYRDGVCDELWFCDADPDCVHPVPSGEPARLPIVLVHGFGGDAGNFAGIAEALRADGHAVYQAALPAFQPPVSRAEVLEGELEAALAEHGAERAHLVGHSAGGLDSRLLASPAGRGRGDLVASVTTIGSPHRGSPAADVVLDLIDLVGVPDGLLDAVARAFGTVADKIADDPDVRAALAAFAERNASAWSREALPDASGVYYQSWTGVSTPFGESTDAMREVVDEVCDGKSMVHEDRFDALPWTELVTWPLAGEIELPWQEASQPTEFADPASVARSMQEIMPLVRPLLDDARPNDGLVPVDSAAWSHFRGCLPSDHASENGIGGGFDPDTGYHPVRFYRNLAYGLAARAR